MAYELIETVEVGAGGASSIEFTSIPQDGVDLVVKVSLRDAGAASLLLAQFNNDTGSNYDIIELSGNGSSVFTAGFNFTGAQIGRTRGDNTANTFTNGETLISNYTSSSAKSLSSDNVTENNGTTASAAITANRYSGTAAITSIKLFQNTGNSFTQHSTASLYKITAA